MNTFLVKTFIISGLVLAAVISSNAQQAAINNIIETIIKNHKTAGAAIAVEKGGNLIFAKSYGYADLKNNTAVTDSTRFNIMSITKAFIAVAVMQLVNRKQINLDAPITKYLDDLPPQYGKVLVFQLLNHSSGIPDYVHVKDYMQQANRKQTPKEILRTVINKPFEFNPGAKTSYSNSNYFLLGMIIEKVTGVALEEYLRTYIFQPAGMKNTYLETTPSINPLKAKGYVSETDSLKEIKPLDPSQYWAAGGIVSTLNDMIKWNNSLMKGKLIPLNELTQMMKPDKLEDCSLSSYGLGFELMNLPDMKIAGNNGVGLGYNASNINFLNDSVTVTVLTNTSNSNSTMIAKNIHDTVEGSPDKEAGSKNIQSETDKLDSVIIHIITDAETSVVKEQYFENTGAAEKFKSEMPEYIRSKGGFIGLVNQGEKINPASIVRRYKINFNKGSAFWIALFSREGKVIAINRMQ